MRISTILFGLTILWHGAGARCDEISFNRDIRPILSDACFFCHGPDPQHREADLRLDEESSAKASVIVPGDADASELIARILSQDDDLRMPPVDSGKSLTTQQIELLTRWVNQGAQYEAYWAYVAPKPYRPPIVKSNWPQNWIDDFLSDQWNSQGMKPAAPADPQTLIRRVTLDLTGLPPTPAQLDAFMSDPSPVAYRRYVDRLLASPAYGERMAIYWLDLVRYADTVGYHGDQDHNISPYRDYVIDALNDDMPFDQFTREQLAGDLLPNPTESQLIATGYNRMLQTSHEGGVQPKEYLAIYAADRIRNLSNVWMGATVGCAQCHDHKYDPYTITDFYSLVAFFADIDEAQHFKVGSNSLPTKRPPEISVLTRWQRIRLADLKRELERLRERLVRVESSAASDLQRRQEIELMNQQIAALESEQQRIESSARMTMITQAIAPREIRVLPRGNWLDESGPVVMPAIPAFLGKLPGHKRATRLDLANWLVDPDQGVGGLTARVFVNRFWYLLFGRGLSATLDDFGGQGEPPSHPQLLDRLATEFISDSWSIKRMMRRMVLSRAYQQSSNTTAQQLATDPENRWFARQSRYRVDAETVRDIALSTSGLLVDEVGGPSVKPFQPPGYYRHLNFPRRIYTPDRDSRQYRRGVYVHWQRQFLHPMLKSMDAPSREECTAARPRSNTPLEALTMLNDPSLVDAAIALGSRLMKSSAANDEERIAWGIRLALARNPDQHELETLLALLREESTYYQDHPQDADALIESAEKHIDTANLDRADLAAWTAIARAILNLQETVTRN